MLYHGKPPVNMQFLHMFNFLKTMTLAPYCYDRNHLRLVSVVDLIECESEHKNTTSAKVGPDARGMLMVCLGMGKVPTCHLSHRHHLTCRGPAA